MKVNMHVREGRAFIQPQGRFDYHLHRDFRAACDEAIAVPDVREIVVDLGAVEYMDSSALGMMLVLKDQAQAHHRPVALASPRGAVKQVLEIACFGKMFRIDT